MAFVSRSLEVTISLAASQDTGAGMSPAAFSGSNNSNTITLSGLRMMSRITHAGGPSDSMLTLTIYGMTRSQMDNLSTLGMQINLVPKNSIVLTAGDSSTGQATVFAGFILTAFADFNAAPEVSFNVTAQCGLPQAVVPTPVASHKGALDVATFMSSLATVMGKKFENNGINAKLSNAYYTGSPLSQMKQCARDAGVNANVINDTLAIWPKNGSREGGAIPLIAPPPDGQMIGYPAYTAYGIMLKSVFDPSVGFGRKIQVQSTLKPACGIWSVYGLDYALDCLVPRGKWEMDISAYNPKFPTPVVTQ